MEARRLLPFNLPDLGHPLLFPQSDVNKLGPAGEPSSAEFVSQTCTNSRIQTLTMDPKPHIKARNRHRLDITTECSTTVRPICSRSYIIILTESLDLHLHQMTYDLPSGKVKKDLSRTRCCNLSPAQIIAEAWKRESAENQERWRRADAMIKQQYSARRPKKGSGPRL